MLADLVALDRDPFAIPPAALEDVRVLVTTRGGRVVYDRNRTISTTGAAR